MNYRFFYYCFCFIGLISYNSCIPKYGINLKTSEIGDLNAINAQQYDKIVDSMKNQIVFYDDDSMWQRKYSELDTAYYLSGEVLYFKENPRELILIDYYSIRAVYNPKLCMECNSDEDILNGLSPELDSFNRIRITKRVNDLFK